jgi:phage shock protein A
MKVQCKTLQENIDAYDKMIKQLRDEIEKTQLQNEWLVAKIAEYQLQVKELIEQKTAQAVGK